MSSAPLPPWSGLPPWYKGLVPSEQEVALAYIVLGFFLAVTCFVFCKAVSQTLIRWYRLKKLTPYLIMVWLDWGATTVHSVVGWCTGHIKCPSHPSVWLFITIILLWDLEMHCQAQILVNRVSLLLFDHTQARRLRLFVFAIVFILTTSVVIIWTPAKMEINKRWIDANNIWDRGEKICFLLFDVSINMFFVNRIRTALIENGLLKYKRLYRFNLIIISLSILLDIAVIGTTWLPDYWIYIQFRPLVHMVKLYIEMCNAELIGRVAQASNIRNLGHEWCETTNPAVESGSLNMSSICLKRLRWKQGGEDNNNGSSPRGPAMSRNDSASCGAAANGSAIVSKPKTPTLLGAEPSPTLQT
ncbi:hypothetical protein B0T14DRAFT_571924 [Immersiella caudata]|uniref:Uncharacterized protein n=1 Tax=Immersiella caudata TaxID=314043 RepID=A0AA39U6I5_9PEZI|nr:hypothetical protein B0T14DRAFT_571924 [Immersiella caudata]